MTYSEEDVKDHRVKIPKSGRCNMLFEKEYDENYFPFNMMSSYINKSNPRSVPGLLNILRSVSRDAEILFVDDLLVHMDINTGVVTMDAWEKFNPSQLRSLYRKLAKLKKAELLLPLVQLGEEKKPPKFTYVINPYHIKPLNYKDARKLWKLIGGKEL